jgi:carbonic anhydrase/acetyltransferase-like protein (isoleucine patch superfamily)
MIEQYREHSPIIDESAYIHASAVVIGEVTIGAESSVWPNTTLRADDGHIIVGSQTSIQDGSVVHMTSNLSDTNIGSRVTVGHKVLLHGCQIEDDCLIGMGAILLDNVCVGHHSLIGAGALVLQRTEIPPYSLVLGSPARVVRKVTEQELEQIEFGWRHYVERTRIYRGESA